MDYNKTYFYYKILLEIGRNLDQKSEEGFDVCIKFLTNAEESLQYWAKYFTATYCDSESRLSTMSIAKLSYITKFLIETAKFVSKKDQTFPFRDWMNRFRNAAGPVSLLEGQQEIEIFMKEFEKRLTTVQNGLEETFQTLTYSAILERCEQAAHDLLFKEISGCTAQCPFCKAQCEFTDKDHLPTDSEIKDIEQYYHRTEHRPQCFGKFRWAQDSTMIRDVCPHLVAGFQTFRNDKTSGYNINITKITTQNGIFLHN